MSTRSKLASLAALLGIAGAVFPAPAPAAVLYVQSSNATRTLYRLDTSGSGSWTTYAMAGAVTTFPHGIETGPTATTVYVANSGTYGTPAVGVYTLSGGTAANANFSTSPASTTAPYDVARDSSCLYVSDSSNKRVVRKLLDGSGTGTVICATLPAATKGLVFLNGSVYVTSGSSLYEIPNAATATSTTVASLVDTAAYPLIGLASDGADFYATDGGNRLLKYSATTGYGGEFSTIATYTGGGMQPVVCADGKVYVGLGALAKVMEYNPDGTGAKAYNTPGGTVYGLAVAAGTGDATGTQARRIADVLQRFGVNTFSKLNRNGYPWSWGGSQGSYDAVTTGLALNYLTGTSGLTLNVREYHRGDGSASDPLTPLQKGWIRDVHQATGAPFSIAIGANGGANDIGGIVAIVQDSISSGMNYVKWVEGINEPNMNFGSGVIPVATTASVQMSLYQQIHAITSSVAVAGPSVVFALPNPENSLNSYLSTYKQTILDHSDANNIHVYPPKSPNAYDGNSRGGALADINTGVATALPGKPMLNTEWHTTFYSSIHKNDPAYEAYWGPIYLLSTCLDFDWQASFQFALFDYNSVSMRCGLFATDNTNPRPVANALRALFQLTGDHGTDKLTFVPEKLDVTVAGLPPKPSGSLYAGGRWTLLENSAHEYFLLLWNEQNDLNAATTPVTVTFNAHDMAKVEEFNITSGSQTPVQTLTGVHTLTVNLDTSLRLLRITY